MVQESLFLLLGVVGLPVCTLQCRTKVLGTNFICKIMPTLCTLFEWIMPVFITLPTQVLSWPAQSLASLLEPCFSWCGCKISISFPQACLAFSLLIFQSLATGSGFIGLAQGFKILANCKVCTVLWTMVAALCTGICASIRTLNKLAILTWIGFGCIFTAVFIVVWVPQTFQIFRTSTNRSSHRSVGVTQVDRPAAAPKSGEFVLEVIAVGNPGFVAGLTAVTNLFGMPYYPKQLTCSTSSTDINL